MRPEVRANTGRLTVTCRALLLGGSQLRAAAVQLTGNGRQYRGELQFDPATMLLSGRVDVPDVELWWPHSHGEPALYAAEIHLEVTGGAQPPTRVEVDLAQVGFRTLELDRGDGDFALRINGQDVFCRGAVWTPLDCVSLQTDVSQYRAAVAQARAAGMNMLRVAGPFVYESTALLDACAAAGMLLWQDFMFANMDYPAADPEFAASVSREARQMLEQWQGQPALAILCGNSEVSQQAAMSGAGREHWLPPLFEETLADDARDYCPDVPYCPCSTHGGDFPFSARQGVTSYYGVGAYLRAAGDARRSELKFASECLAFANVPETETLETAADGPLHFNQPRWKQRVPRDLGAGWDFDDVRDHYLQQLFGLPAAPMRYSDQDRYLRLSRIASGEAMAGAFAEWRRARSPCRGALLLFLRDLWPGAGWGIVDSTGLPKAPYYYLRRVLRNVALFVSDEGNNGLSLHLCNETSQPLHGQLQLELYNASQPVGRTVSRVISIGAAAALELNALDWFEGFLDLSYAYRFGPPAYDVLRVSFHGDGIPEHTEAYHFPLGLPNTRVDVGLSASARAVPEGVAVEVTCQAFAHAVHIEAAGYCPDDQYFHLAPRARRIVTMRPRSPDSGAFEGMVWAANAQYPRRVESAP
jgi:beta-mannosidase